MGTINLRRDRPRNHPEPHLNWMGGPSYTMSPLLRLKTAAASCFFGEPQYYHKDSKAPQRRSVGLRANQIAYLRSTLNAVDKEEWRSWTPAKILEDAIDDALASDPVGTLAFAEELRQDLNIRTTPQVIMARASRHPAVKGTGLLAKHGGRILQRMDEPTVQMAYYLHRFGKPIPSSLKRAWQRRLERAKPYELAKYRMEGRDVNLYDVVNVCHPRSTEALTRLMRGEAKQTGDNETWESIRSNAGKVSSFEEAKVVWEKASKKMGHMALLRNLRNLDKSGALTDELLSELIRGVDKGRQLPFRYYTAYKAVADRKGKISDAIEECLERSFRHAPHFSGRVMSLCDNSGSAQSTFTSSLGTMTIAEIGNLMAVMTAKMSDEGHVGVFGDRLSLREVRKKSSIFDELSKVQRAGQSVGGSTEHGIWLFWEKAIREKEHWDHVFVYSDMQAGHGGLYGRSVADYPLWFSSSTYIDVPALIRKYRAKVNPNVNVYLVQVAGYTDTLVPEFYDRTYILGGWSEHILRFAEYMTQLRR